MSELFYDGAPATKGQKVMLATTVYENPDASYTFAIQRSREALHADDVATEYVLLSGNCHVDDARNSVVQEFLSSDCTDLVFLDADVSWEPEALVKLCRYDCDVVGGVYPHRRDTSEARHNMPVLTIPGMVDPAEDGLLQVAGLPTGFMRIRRKVLEILDRDADRYSSRNRRTEIPIIFERSYRNGSRLGGDLNFCKKWHDAGGKLYAAYEMRLGHTAKTVVHDSLGAALRRQGRETLRHVADQIRAGSTDLNMFSEARRYLSNEYGAIEDVLSLCMIMAREADGPILEAGSGLSTIVMAAATDQPIYCLEHDPVWAMQLEKMIGEAGVSGIGLCLAPIKDGWYDLTDFPDLPGRFALGVNDGPPRAEGSRMGFYEHFGDRCDAIVVDDADDRGYAEAISQWCADTERQVDFVQERAALIRNKEEGSKLDVAV